MWEIWPFEQKLPTAKMLKGIRSVPLPCGQAAPFGSGFSVLKRHSWANPGVCRWLPQPTHPWSPCFLEWLLQLYQVWRVHLITAWSIRLRSDHHTLGKCFSPVLQLRRSTVSLAPEFFDSQESSLSPAGIQSRHSKAVPKHNRANSMFHSKVLCKHNCFMFDHRAHVAC